MLPAFKRALRVNTRTGFDKCAGVIGLCLFEVLIKPTQSAICAVMLYDAKLSQIYAARMQEEGIYVTGFYYPVVPKEQARIRVQISAGHEKEHLDKCIEAFIKVGKELGVLAH